VYRYSGQYNSHHPAPVAFSGPVLPPVSGPVFRPVDGSVAAKHLATTASQIFAAVPAQMSGLNHLLGTISSNYSLLPLMFTVTGIGNQCPIRLYHR
jgi:hypothetical protein